MHRWTAAVAVFGAFLVLAPPARPQDPQAPAEKRLDFKFRDASVEHVLDYVRKQMGWTLITSPSAKLEGTVTAYSDSPVSESRVIDFLNTALQKAKLQVFLYEGILKVVTEEEAKKGTFNISVGDDPSKIPINETVWTWVFPLRNLNVDEVEKKLAEVVKGDLQHVAYSPYSNSVILTGRNSTIYRAARILKIIDVQAPDKLEVRLFKMRFADAQETAKLLNDVFKRPEGPTGRGGGGNPWQQMAQAWGGGGGGGQGQGPMPRTLVSEMLRITADIRTNSVIATATKDNLDMLEKVVKQMDGETTESVRLKLYPLRYADSKAVADLITKVYEDEASQSRQANRAQQQQRLPVWMGGAPSVGNEPTGASREVRAVADIRSNSVVVAANEGNMRTIDDLIANLDRQLTDILRIKIYELKNANATQMATTLREMFRPQITATQNAGRPQQQGGQPNAPFGAFGNRSGAGAGSSLLAPNQEIEITPDARTNSVVVKASEDYIAVINEIVEQLDRNPTEALSTYVIGLRNANAGELAQVIQQLLRGGSAGTGNRPNQNQNQGNRNANSNNQRPATRTGGNNSTRNLGPLQDQDPAPAPEPPSQDAPQDEDQRRSVEGQADVQADTATNSLVIRTSPRNLEALRSIIQNLDRPRPQVLIKVLIAEVTLDKDTRYGVEGFWENKFRVNGDAITQRHGTNFDLPTTGFSTLITGDEMQAALNAFSEEGRLKVLATPRVLVLDNSTANINVGKEVPRVTNSTINQLGNTVNTVTYERLGILLEVTPHINFDGLVTIDVHPEISDIAPVSEAIVITPGVTSPTFNVNSADTTVAVRTGQTVVIGGLIRESQSDTITKVPLLGDIPILGLLFSNTVKETIQRELMIFLTPIVAYTSAQLEEMTELEKAKLKLIDDGDVEDGGDAWLKRIRE